jgi:hypothetical protein
MLGAAVVATLALVLQLRWSVRSNSWRATLAAMVGAGVGGASSTEEFGAVSQMEKALYCVAALGARRYV